MILNHIQSVIKLLWYIVYNPGRDSEDKIAKLISMQWIDSTPEFQNKTKAKVDVGGTENIYKRKNIKRKSKQ